MRKLAVAVSFLAVSAAAASAADLAARPYTKAPAAVVEAYNWTGFYIGSDVGGGWAKTSASTQQFPPGVGTADLQFFNLKGSGVLGGLHAGYNWQVAPNWVLGIEGDGDGTGIKASTSGPLTIGGIPIGIPGLFTTNDALSRNVNWLASIRGRAGYAAGNWLLYATGGAAWGGLQQSATQTLTVPAIPGVGGGASVAWPFSSSSTRSGWVAGAGAEYAFKNNWIVRGEYLFYSLNGTNGTGLPIISGVLVAAGPNFFADTFGRTTIQTVRVGISYKFGGPVVAKY